MIPLSFGQQRLWLLDRFEGAGWTYNIVMRARMQGDLDVAALEAALYDLLERHEALRTVFPDDDGVPRQEVVPTGPDLGSLTVVEHPGGAPAEALDDVLAGVLDKLARYEFDLATEIPFRAVLVPLAPGDHMLYLLMHHIAVDGWSMDPLLRDLAAAYSARRSGRAPDWEPLPVQYADFALWERSVLGTADDPDSLLCEQLDHWRSALGGMPQEIALPADRSRTETATFRGGAVPFLVEAGLHRDLSALAGQSRATLFMVLHTAVAALYSRLGAGTDIPVGTGLAGRSDEALNDVVGFFVSTLALRTDVSGDPSFRELIARVRDFDLRAFDNQEAPFDRVVEALAPQRVPGRHPLFQTMLAVQGDYRSDPGFAGLSVEAGKEGIVERQTAKFDLYFDLSETWDANGAPTGVKGELKYAADLWDEPSVVALAERFLRILEAMAADPDSRISRAEILSGAERAELSGTPKVIPDISAELLELMVRQEKTYSSSVFRSLGIRVLDADLGLVPAGVVADIYVSGEAAEAAEAAGSRDPAESGEPLLPDPYGGPSARLLRTGRRGRRLRDGRVELLPRESPNARDVLPELREPGPGRHHPAAPRTARQEILCGMFAEMLGADTVGIHDDFFDLGGNSLLAARIATRVRTLFGVRLELSAVFRAPTVAKLDAVLHRSGREGAGPRPAVPRPAPLPVAPTQLGLWMVDQIQGPSASYNIPYAVRLTGPLDAAALEAAVNDAVRRHEALRTVFPDDDAEPCQYVLPEDEVHVALRRESCEDDGIADRLAEHAGHVFDLAGDEPLIRCHLITSGPDSHVLLLLVHHIVFDGASLAPLLRDLATAYEARLRGRAPVLPEVPVQYADYALWQRGVLGDPGDPDSVASRQLRFWREALAGLPEESTLPAGRGRPATPDLRSGIVPVTLDADLHRALLRVARATGVTLFMTLHAGFAALLGLLGAGEDIVIGTPVAGRSDEVLDGVVGYFVNTLPLRTDLSGEPTFRELMLRVRESDLAAYARQEVPFDRVVQELNPPRAVSRNPLFQVGFALEQGAPPRFCAEGLTAEALSLYGVSAKLDLDLTLTERFDADGMPAGVTGTLEYPTVRYGRSTVEDVAARLASLLATLADDPHLRPVTAMAAARPPEMEL